jgi:GNAT superfamily N-acetyltransferase
MDGSADDLIIRPAAPSDAAVIYGFIRELAAYEQLLDQVQASEAGIARVLFCDQPRAFCDIAERGGAPVGFALWFYNLSTFTGRHGIYLEDLYVRPEARGAGAGKALLAGLARRCVEEGLSRLEWAVLDWNASAIGFYDRLGAGTQSEWVVRRLSGEALARLAGMNRP